jgi:hypothetical protein
MSVRKFWCCTFGGGIGAQFDWLAIHLTGSPTVSAPACRDVADVKPEQSR